MSNRVFSIGKTLQRVADGGDLMVDMAFASQVPYERWWGVEVLDVSEKAVRLGRLNDGASVLFNHDWNDVRGVHVEGSVKPDSDGVLRGKIRLTSATQAGRDTIAMVESGVLSKASVGYQIHKVIQVSKTKSDEGSTTVSEREIDGRAFERAIESATLTRDGRAIGGDLQAFRRSLDDAIGSPFQRAGEDQPDTFKVVDWEPLENSIVTVPADPTVGVGRTAERSLQPAATTAKKGSSTMSEQQAAAGVSAEPQPNGAQAAAIETRGASGAGSDRAVELERNRRRGIENLCKANKIDDTVREYWVGTGMSVEQISDDLLKIVEERGKANPTSVTKIGLSENETKRYSLFNAIRAVADKNWNNAGFELEASRTIAQKLGRAPDPHKFYVPFEVQQRSVPMRRDLTAASASGGGYLVGTDNMSFIEVLRNRSIAYRMGARRLSGLVGNVTVPKQTAAATAVWLSSESATATESAQTFGQLALSPKTVGAYTEISRQLMLQSSPDAEGIVTADLGSVCALAVDVGVIRGSGSSGEPTGIVNTGSIGTVSGTTFGYAAILEFQTDVAGANVVPAAGGYVTTPSVAALAMARQRFSSTDTPLWQGNIWDGQMAGFPAMSSNQMASGTMLFGDWSQVVVGEWGVLEVEVNPYANFQAGIIGVRALVSIDVGLRYAGAFSYGAAMT
jgi:HK97 family phage major capsid protein